MELYLISLVSTTVSPQNSASLSLSIYIIYIYMCVCGGGRVCMSNVFMYEIYHSLCYFSLQRLMQQQKGINIYILVSGSHSLGQYDK